MNLPIKILFNVSADEHVTNAQSLNAKAIALRLNSKRYLCFFFVFKKPDPKMIDQKHIRFISVPKRLGSLKIIYHHVFCRYDIFIYLPLPPVVRILNKLYWLGIKDKLIVPIEGPISFLKKEYPIGEKNLFKAFRMSNYIMPISSFVREDFLRESGMNTFRDIPVGIDTKTFVPAYRKESNCIQVLYIGRLIKRKGPQYVVEAAKRFPKINFKLVGSSYEKEDSYFADNLKQDVLKEGLMNIEFLGKVSQERIRELMKESDILLLPSRVEGIPKVTLEAAATGLPCIVFDDYRTPSVVDDVTGFQVKTFDEMLERLRLLIDNREIRLDMGAAAVEHAKKFDWDIIVKQWEEIFEKVISAKR